VKGVREKKGASTEGARFEASYGCPLPTGKGLGSVLCPSQKIFLLIFGKWAIIVKNVLCSGKRGKSISQCPTPKYTTDAAATRSGGN